MAEIDEQDTTRATNDAYTGMLAISLIALLVGCALLYLDYSQYPGNPPKVTAPAPPSGGGAPPPPPAGAQGAQAPQDGKAVAPMPNVPAPMPMPMPTPMNPPAKQ